MTDYHKRTFTLLCLFVSLIIWQPAFAQSQEQEVKNLHTVVESKLEKVKRTDAVNFAAEEINAIHRYIEETRRLLKDEEYQRAYYVISIAVSYFNLIDAKSELKKSRDEFLAVKEKLNEK